MSLSQLLQLPRKGTLVSIAMTKLSFLEALELTLELLTETFGAWSRPAILVEGSPREPEGRAPRVRVRNGDVERPLANLGWRTVGTLHPDAAALDAAATILGVGRGSRLYRAVRTPGLAASARREAPGGRF